jgi:hypothetical protein
MKVITISLGLMALAATAAVLWQQHTLSTLAQAPRAGAIEAGVSSEALAGKARSEEEITRLREQTKELPKLRNEVQTLRSISRDLTAARSEFARLASAQTNSAAAPPLPPGFISRQQLAHVGFATPDDAVQTFFWAVTQGKLETIMQALAPENRERKSFERLSPEQRATMIEDMNQDGPAPSMKHFNDFGVRSRENPSADRTTLHVGSSLTTNTIAIQLQRYNGEWRILDLPR